MGCRLRRRHHNVNATARQVVGVRHVVPQPDVSTALAPEHRRDTAVLLHVSADAIGVHQLATAVQTQHRSRRTAHVNHRHATAQTQRFTCHCFKATRFKPRRDSNRAGPLSKPQKLIVADAQPHITPDTATEPNRYNTTGEACPVCTAAAAARATYQNSRTCSSIITALYVQEQYGHTTRFHCDCRTHGSARHVL